MHSHSHKLKRLSIGTTSLCLLLVSQRSASAQTDVEVLCSRAQVINASLAQLKTVLENRRDPNDKEGRASGPLDRGQAIARRLFDEIGKTCEDQSKQPESLEALLIEVIATVDLLYGFRNIKASENHAIDASGPVNFARQAYRMVPKGLSSRNLHALRFTWGLRCLRESTAKTDDTKVRMLAEIVSMCRESAQALSDTTESSQLDPRVVRNLGRVLKVEVTSKSIKNGDIDKVVGNCRRMLQEESKQFLNRIRDSALMRKPQDLLDLLRLVIPPETEWLRAKTILPEWMKELHLRYGKEERWRRGLVLAQIYAVAQVCHEAFPKDRASDWFDPSLEPLDIHLQEVEPVSMKLVTGKDKVEAWKQTVKPNRLSVVAQDRIGGRGESYPLPDAGAVGLEHLLLPKRADEITYHLRLTVAGETVAGETVDALIQVRSGPQESGVILNLPDHLPPRGYILVSTSDREAFLIARRPPTRQDIIDVVRTGLGKENQPPRDPDLDSSRTDRALVRAQDLNQLATDLRESHVAARFPTKKFEIPLLDAWQLGLFELPMADTVPLIHGDMRGESARILLWGQAIHSKQ